MHHLATAPFLEGSRSEDDPQQSPQLARRSSMGTADTRSAAKRLLDELSTRLNEVYRSIHFKGKPSKSYKQRVLFDTIDIQSAENENPWSDDEDDVYTSLRRLSMDEPDYSGRARGRGRDRELKVPTVASQAHSPSPTRMLSPIRGMDMLKFFSRRIPYPTTPIITHRGCTFTQRHRDFEPLYLGQLSGKGLRPILPHRVILVYISGRKHTWVSLDWALRSFIEDGDTVVIVAAINHKLGPPASQLTKYPSPQRYIPRTPRVRQRQRNRPEFVKEVASNIMTYATSIINPDVIAKVTVEIVQGKTKDVLKDMYLLYEPTLVVTGTKANPRNSAPLKLWLLSRLSDRIVKNFPLPVIVVPALNMAPFEESLEETMGDHLPALQELDEILTVTGKSGGLLMEDSALLTDKSTSTESAIVDTDDINSDVGSLTSGSVRSESTVESSDSAQSWASVDDIAELYNNYRNELRTKMDNLKAKPIDDQYFANFLSMISDQSLEFCDDVRGMDPDFRGKGAVLARAITGSTYFGRVPYKTKSLLGPVEVQRLTSPTGSSSMSYSELKRNLQANAARAKEELRKKQELLNEQSVPHIAVEPASPGSLSPTTLLGRPSALKFQDPVAPRRLSAPKAPRVLKKYLSHEDLASSRPNIEPSKSHPDIRTVMSGDSDRKKKKKFWKLF